MSSNTQQPDDSTDTTVSCECPHDVPRTEAVSIPGVGYVCRDCHTPFPVDDWPDVIDNSKAHHHTGETSHYATWLVGLDEYGRALYHDERNKTILVLVPKYHSAYRQDVDGDERPFRRRGPKHGGRGKLVNAPDNGVLVLYDKTTTNSDDWSKKHLCEWVAERAARDGWDAVTERTLEKLAYYTDQYDAERYRDDVFPVAAGRRVLDRYQDDE